MSMETTCLKCRTVFRVTTEQLNAHQGDVRCGVCGTLFNAFDSLAPARNELQASVDIPPAAATDHHPPAPPESLPAMESPAPMEIAEPVGMLTEQPPPSEEAAPQVVADDTESFADFEAALLSEQVPVAGPPAASETSPDTAEAQEDHFADFASAFEAPVSEAATDEMNALPEPVYPEAEAPVSLESPPPPSRQAAIKNELNAIEDIYANFAKNIDLSPLPSATQLVEERRASGTTGEAEPGQRMPSPESEPPVAQENTHEGDAFEPSVDDDLLEPVNKAPNKRRGWLWGIAAFPLLLVLLGQLAYFYRVELATRYPATRPLLEQACAGLHCNVPLPRNADLLKIESSDLEADTELPSRVTLSCVVSNRAAYRQAYPQLELTLTNHEDRPLARRIFSPADYLATSVDAKQGMAANSEVTIRLDLDLGDLNAIGYRLYVLYSGKNR